MAAPELEILFIAVISVTRHQLTSSPWRFFPSCSGSINVYAEVTDCTPFGGTLASATMGPIPALPGFTPVFGGLFLQVQAAAFLCYLGSSQLINSYLWGRT